jgi:hypothetical protein
MLTSKSSGALFVVLGLGSCFAIPSCSTTKDDGLLATGGTTAMSTTAQGGSGHGGAPSSDTGGVVSIIVNDGGAAGTGTLVECTAGEGEGCNCPTVNIAVLGKAGKWGANPDGDSDTAFQDWLNSSSVGTAKVDNYVEKPALTKEFLATYNVIVLAGLGDDSNLGPFWNFDNNEQAEVWEWVNNGGGIVSLSGYAGNQEEILPKNQLLTFSGISYNSDGVTPDCAIVSASGGQVCWCGGSSPLADFNKDDPFVANLSNSVTWVGLQVGRSINAPSDAVVAATVTPSGQPKVNVLVGKAVGKGRVLVYADEWITYTSQWNGEGNPNSTNTACTGLLPQDVYQTAQFWYNMIKWVQPEATCFKIVDNTQEVVIW